jgi:preprotein translocase subunit SecE
MADTIHSARDFVVDVQDQMKKVTWPDWPQLKNSTGIIIIFVVVLAVVIFGIDFVVSGALTVVRSLFGA